MKRILKRAFFLFEELVGISIGSLVRPFRLLSIKLFTTVVALAHRLGDKTTVLLTPFLMEFGRAALDDRTPVWVFRTLVGGSIIRLDLAEKTQRNIFLAYRYEAGLTNFVISVLKPGDVFVDVGANVGYYTLMAAAKVGEKGRVIACEPEERNFQLLRTNVDANHYTHIQLLQTAVGEESGTATLHINPLNRGGNSILPFDRYKTGTHTYDRVFIERKYGRDTLEQKVSVRTLDDVLDAEHVLPIRVLKIDVEGFEASVFRGMKKVLEKKSIDYILCEISSDSARHTILEIIKNAGYAPYRIDPRGSLIPVVGKYPRDVLFSKGLF